MNFTKSALVFLLTQIGASQDIALDLAPIVQRPPLVAVGVGDQESLLHDATSETEHTFESMNKKLGELSQDLSNMRQTTEAEVSAQATLFKAQLDGQDKNNSALSSANSLLEEEIKILTHGNAEKRDQANKISQENADLTSQLRQYQEDLSHADEFVDLSLSDLADVNAPELEVLHELDTQDKSASISEEHRQRLDEIHSLGKGSIGMPDMSDAAQLLELSPGEPIPAAQLLGGLESGLTEFSKHRQEGQDVLKAHFLEKFKAGSVVRVDFLKMQAQLMTTRASLKKIDSQLVVAIEHLTKIGKKLKEDLAAAQRFTSDSSVKVAKASSALSLAQTGSSSGVARFKGLNGWGAAA